MSAAADTDTKPYAICPHCRAPLIATMDWPGYEFYCLECGNHFDFISPIAADETPDLMVRYRVLRAEWDEHVEGRLMLHGGWLHRCPTCRERKEPHRLHATPEEFEQQQIALAWLRQRAA